MGYSVASCTEIGVHTRIIQNTCCKVGGLQHDKASGWVVCVMAATAPCSYLRCSVSYKYVLITVCHAVHCLVLGQKLATHPHVL